MMKTELRKIRELIQYACDEMGCNDLAPHITITWNNRFTARIADAKYSGTIRDPQPKAMIRISTKLWPTMNEEDKEDTILHETAHLIDAFAHGNKCVRLQDRSGHGPTWREIAKRVGARPRRYAQEHEAAFAKYRRKTIKYKVRCGCTHPHIVSKNLLTRMQKGSLRRCRKCNKLLRPQSAEVCNG